MRIGYSDTSLRQAEPFVKRLSHLAPRSRVHPTHEPRCRTCPDPKPGDIFTVLDAEPTDDLPLIRCAVYTRQSVVRAGDVSALASCAVQRTLCTESTRAPSTLSVEGRGNVRGVHRALREGRIEALSLLVGERSMGRQLEPPPLLTDARDSARVRGRVR